ncbi:MAG: CvpA family protein [Acidimicrobiales bacterium]
MDWVDLAIAVLVTLAAITGWVDGAITRVLHVAGLAIGFFAIVALAPSLSSHVTHGAARPVVALVIVGVGTLVCGLVGRALGGFFSRALETIHLGIVDRVGGVLVGAVSALVGCWLIAGLLASTTWASIATQVQGSAILRAVDAVMPPLPAVEQRVQTLLRQADLPAIFAEVVAPTLTPPVALDRLPAARAPVGGPPGIVKVFATGGCANASEGTAFYVRPTLALTNAHVVAGHLHVTAGGAPATVVAYDATDDLALLRVARPGAPLALSSATPARGRRLNVVGYPLNGARTLTPAYMEGTTTALSRDIYGGHLEARTFVVLEARIEPGNSGSPLLAGGRAVAVVESMSASQPATGYAIPVAVVAPLLARVGHRPVSTGACVN